MFGWRKSERRIKEVEKNWLLVSIYFDFFRIMLIITIAIQYKKGERIPKNR
jgi:hypothetical protein